MKNDTKRSVKAVPMLVEVGVMFCLLVAMFVSTQSGADDETTLAALDDNMQPWIQIAELKEPSLRLTLGLSQ